MKRLLVLLMAIVTCISLFACSGGIEDYNDVADYFDDDVYKKQFYINEELETVKNNLVENGKAFGVDLTGDVQFVVLMRNEAAQSEEEFDWAYIIQCYDETGASEVEQLVSQTRSCRRFGKVVVYGTAPVIDEISE